MPLQNPRLLLALAALGGLFTRLECIMEKDCYQFGSGGWDLIWWGDPDVRLPHGDVIPICATTYGYVVFRWRDPQGVFLIPSEQCPDSFDPPWNDTFAELAPVSASNRMGFTWTPPQEPGATFWVTSQAPGACQAGVKVQIEVVGPVTPPLSSAAEQLSWRRHTWALVVSGVLLALAANNAPVAPASP